MFDFRHENVETTSLTIELGLVRDHNMMLAELIQSVYILQALLNAQGLLVKTRHICPLFWRPYSRFKTTWSPRTSSIEDCWQQSLTAFPPKVNVESDALFVLAYSDEDLMSTHEGSVTAFKPPTQANEPPTRANEPPTRANEPPTGVFEPHSEANEPSNDDESEYRDKCSPKWRWSLWSRIATPFLGTKSGFCHMFAKKKNSIKK